ncbi:FAD-dependent monooxygenase [Streptomyces sp. 35G-GA-8]|uniref:FAD-dependent monooxygenase n=1 Tax=Streptomyces sp. 35G-GA-8 TaxID=2939434 RepID=UPI00201F3BBC|nr:FAD-dependent monooxygenase [Streptomyces sp. 35G-GA-8]MCL7380571.1 FAD-dependent monooxygenase [Streptomyces sp. 35G-GA-8]
MRRRILIVGAGLTGLALANGLRRARDVEVTIVEQAPVIAEAGWAIVLAERHLDALRRLGLDPAELSADLLSHVVIFDPDTSVPVAMAGMGGRITARSALQMWLYEPVRDQVRTGISPVAIADRGALVEAEFSDGSRGEFDAVVAADGIDSWTRRTVLGGPEAGYAGSAVLRFQVPNIDGLDVTSMTSDGSLGYFLMDGGRTLNATVFLPGEPDNHRDHPLAGLAERHRGLRGPLRSLVQAMRTEPVGYYANIRQVVTDRWTSGRVTLVGDAAHAMSPRLGQGAGVGLRDAATLTELLTLPDLPVPAALAGFAAIRMPEAHRVQRQSHAATVRVGQRGAALGFQAAAADLGTARSVPRDRGEFQESVIV